jgi:hypothetical protein
MARTVFAESVTPAFFVPPPAVVVPTYQGPGDILPGALAWYGLRGYAATYSGKCIDISDASGSNFQTINIVANRLDVASVAFWSGIFGQPYINVWWDQTGNNVRLDPFTPSGSHRPMLVLNVLSGYPVARFSSANNTALTNSTGFTQAQPFFVSWVALKTGSNPFSYVVTDSSLAVVSGFGFSLNHIIMYAGSAASVSATDNTFYAVQQNFNGNTTSDMMIDGALSSGLSPSTSGMSGQIYVGTGDPVTDTFDGDILELGIWAGNQSANEAALNSNQHGTNGYNF